MKLLNSDKGRFLFHLEPKEKQVLFQVLAMYPLIPVTHHQLSKSERRPEDQALLEEAVAAERQRHKRQVEAMLNSRTVFVEGERGCEFTLKAAQMEWLLQVLNDVRVGAWLTLGSPDGVVQTLAALNDKNARYFWAMEMAGRFESALLRALSGDVAGEVLEE